MTTLPLTKRSGMHYRVYDPRWADPPSDTSYSLRTGGRWNIRSRFGALHLNATVDVAAAQVRFQFRNRAIKLFDLKPSHRPMLATFTVQVTPVVDAVTTDGLRTIGLPARFPIGVDHARCQRIAARANADGVAGIASRSNAAAIEGIGPGEELALFDTHPLPEEIAPALAFANWYPDDVAG